MCLPFIAGDFLCCLSVEDCSGLGYRAVLRHPRSTPSWAQGCAARVEVTHPRLLLLLPPPLCLPCER